MVERSAVIAALDAVVDPVSGQGLVAAGLVQGLVVGEDRAGFALEVDRSHAAAYAPVRDAAEAANAEGFAVERRQVVLTAPIKDLGLHEVRVHLHPEVDATIRLNVARSAEEAELQASGKSIQDLAAEEDAAADFEIAELFEDIGSAGRDEDEAN